MKQCRNCQYRDLDELIEPCLTCVFEMSNWKEREVTL